MESGLYKLTIKNKLFKSYGTVEFTQCEKAVKGTVKLGKNGKKVYEVSGKVDNNRLEFYGSYVKFRPHFLTVSNCKVDGNTFEGEIEIRKNKKRKVYGEKVECVACECACYEQAQETPAPEEQAE